jgi:hypothetical protein
MAHYAFLDDNNIVTEVIVGRDEDEVVDGISDWEAYYGEFRGQRCVRASYNTEGGVHYFYNDTLETKEASADQSKAFRKNYAGIGFTYDESRDAFIPPSPYPSWVLNEDTCLWEAPIPYPDDGTDYIWDESTELWIEVTE